ncbi:glycine-rich domain-containing protein [Actinomadura harenae]|uniref:Uncharacterized protein n=1 Tax=Actinomadura harenae TaxID=2483351 RepID=A0A3M2M2H7_9ACTN|nr:hypothetical protein [Actinomadura harenae]RMI43300.1 hypothetical protein EBO15_16595 [Actinomadura harenae]
MTIALDSITSTGRDPRELIPGEAFALLVDDFRKATHATHDYCARAVGQNLVFLSAVGRIRCAERQDPRAYVRIVPTPPVDQAWHLSLQRTEVYLPMSLALAGSFIHHRPVMDDDIRSGAALARTIPQLHATGYFVDPEFWEGEAGSSCCPPECNSPGFQDAGIDWRDLLPTGANTIRF